LVSERLVANNFVLTAGSIRLKIIGDHPCLLTIITECFFCETMIWWLGRYFRDWPYRADNMAVFKSNFSRSPEPFRRIRRLLLVEALEGRVLLSTGGTNGVGLPPSADLSISIK